jgi:ferredoxin
VSLAELRHQYDAVLIACGAMAPEAVAGWGLPTGPQGHIAAAKETGATAIAGVFAAGNAVRGKGLVVRSVADGKAAAVAIDQFLSGRPVQGSPPQFSTKMGRLEQAELVQLASGTGEGTWCTQTADTGFTAEEAAGQATRCMHCDCRGLRSCRLRHYAALYGADPRRYPGPRRSFQQDARHAEVIFEPGKCIDCGLCIQIAASAGETLGLSFVGRGFDVRVAVPFDRSLAEALGKVAAACVAACPTAALAWKDAASYKED